MACQPVYFEVTRPIRDETFPECSLLYKIYGQPDEEARQQIKKMEQCVQVMRAFTPLFDRIGDRYKVTVLADANKLFVFVFTNAITNYLKGILAQDSGESEMQIARYFAQSLANNIRISVEMIEPSSPTNSQGGARIGDDEKHNSY